MRRHFILAALPAALLFGAATETRAMSAYARSFDMKCGECHKQRIPELNDFGIAFYKNGFNLPGKDREKSPVEPDEAKPSGNTTAPPHASASEHNENESGAMPVEKAEEPKPSPPPEVPLVIYKGHSGDGSVYFTDNPLSRRRLLEKVKDDPSPAGARTAMARTTPRKTAVSPSRHEQPRYRTYQECMERRLENAPAGSSQQMMDLLMAAERDCAPYPAKNP